MGEDGTLQLSQGILRLFAVLDLLWNFLIPELFCWQKARKSCAVGVRSEDRSERIFVFPEVLS